MNIQEALDSIWLDVKKWCARNRHKAPPFGWTCRQALHVLQLYPTGVTRAMLLTELEVKWRMAVRRGEHAGKLGQVLMLLQLELTEVISGTLTGIDDFRCRLISTEDPSLGIDVIMHRQTSDFTAFSRHHNFPLLSQRAASITHGRLLKGKPLMLLPTPYMSFDLNFAQFADQQFILRVLSPLHYKAFTALESIRSSAHVDMCNEDVTLLFVQVTNIGVAVPHPVSSSTVVLVVQLQVIHPDEARLSDNGPASIGNKRERPENSPRTVYMILLDEQVSLARLWQAGDLLLVYRPYVGLNAQEVLFGSRTHGSSAFGAHAMAHDVVHRAVSDLDGALDDPWTLPVHFFYGGITVCCVVRGTVSNSDFHSARMQEANLHSYSSSTAFGSPRGSSAEVCVTAGPTDFLSLCHTACAGPFSLLVRVLACKETSSLPDSSVDLWVQPLVPYSRATDFRKTLQTSTSLQSTSNQAKVCPPTLICIRCTANTLLKLRLQYDMREGHTLFLAGLFHDERHLRRSTHDPCVLCADELVHANKPAHISWAHSAHIIALALNLDEAADDMLTEMCVDTNESRVCIVNVSRLTTLLSSPSVFPPALLPTRWFQPESLLNKSTMASSLTPQRSWLSIAVQSGCLVVCAHVIAAFLIAPDVLRLQLCDGSDGLNAYADVGPWTVNLSRAFSPEAASNLSSESVGHQDKFHSQNPSWQKVGETLGVTWRGQQFTFLLCRMDDVLADGNSTATSVTKSVGSDSNSSFRLCRFRVEAVAETDKRATAWMLLETIRTAVCTEAALIQS